MRTLFLAAALALSANAAVVQDQRMTRDPGTTCDLPVSTDTFYATDTAAYVWFKALQAKRGDLGRDEWIDPSGAVYRTSLWNAIEKDGNFCMWARMEIAGQEAARKPGRWQVKVYWNDTLLFAIDFTITASTAGPQISSGGVVNAADYTARFAPGCLISVFGEGFAGAGTAATTVPLPTQLAGVSAELLSGDQVTPLPLFFVSANQINAQLPYQLPSDPVRLRVRTAAGLSNEAVIAVEPRNPRLFTQTLDGRGEALVLHADYSLVRPGSPARPSEVLILYLTGLGAVSPPVAAGSAAGDGSVGRPLNMVEERVEVMLGGRPTEVLFAGLAPGFAGLYQVNFRVPVDVPSGAWDIVVGCARQNSQQSVRMSVVGNVAPPAGSIGPAGGRVESQGIEIAVPAGGFNQNASLQIEASNRTERPAQVTPIYTIAGLPVECTTGITLTVRPTAPLDTSQKLVALVRAASGPESLARLRGLPDAFEAQIAGDQVRVVIPPWDFREASNTAAVSKEGTPRAASVPIAFELSITGRWRYADTTGKGLSRMWVEASGSALAFPDSVILDLQRALEQSRNDFTQTLKISWPERKWPLDVYIYDFWSGTDEGREGVTIFGKSRQVINLNARQMNPNSASSLAQVKRTAVHELFHLLQNLLNPGRGWTYALGGGTAWDWFFEACSTWWEMRLPGPIPSDVQIDNVHFLGNGLEYNEREHGYGASLFLEYLSNRYGPEMVGSILKKIENYNYMTTTPYLYVPTAAMIDALPAPLSDVWRDFGKAFLEGKLFKDVVWPDADRFGRDRSQRFLTLMSLSLNPKDTVWYRLESPALSGKFFGVAIPAGLPADQLLQMTVSGGADLEVLVYGFDSVKVSGKYPPARPICTTTRDKPVCTIDQPSQWSGTNRFLAVLVINPDTLRPFNLTQLYTLEFKLIPDPLAALKQMPFITAVIGSPVLCSGTQVTSATCEDQLTLSTSGRSIWDFSTAAVPAWNDVTYTATTSSTSATTVKRLDISGSLDNSGKVLTASGKFWLTETYTSPYYTSQTTYGFAIKDLPLVEQRPSAYRFEIRHPQDWRKYVTEIQYKVVRTEKGVTVVEKQYTGLQWPANSYLSITFWRR